MTCLLKKYLDLQSVFMVGSVYSKYFGVIIDKEIDHVLQRHLSRDADQHMRQHLRAAYMKNTNTYQSFRFGPSLNKVKTLHHNVVHVTAAY